MKEVNELILSKDNFTDQLVLLSEHKDNKNVQEYIEGIMGNQYTSGYVKYMIEKYYYKNENAIKCGMNSLEKTFKVLLRPIELKVKEKKNVSTNIKVGECVLIIDGPYKNINGTIKSIYNEYGEFDVLINLFGEEFTVKVKFEDVEVK